jgi:hypothetical protein
LTKLHYQNIPHTSRFSLHLKSESTPEIGADVARIIVNCGLDLLEMRRTNPTLEDIFLAIINSEL